MARNDYKNVFEQSLDNLRQLSNQELNHIVLDFPDIPKQFIPFRTELNPNDRKTIRPKKTNSQSV